MERQTIQKQIILDYLKSVKTHPDAEEVYKAVKKRLPQISRGTVYRNLDNFVKEGLVLEIKTEKKRFDGDTSHHQHFVCKNCGKVYDFFEKNVISDVLKDKIRKVGDFDDSGIYIYGICRKCRNGN